MVAVNEKLRPGAGPQNLPVGDYYLLQDTLYRAAALTDSGGNIVEAYGCDAYGNTLIFTGADSSGNWWGDSATQSNFGANDIIYCGYRYDPETENYYVRNRFYSPTLGRWLTRDPIGYQGGVNLYEYVGGDPAGNMDPAGAVSPDRGLPLRPHGPGGPLEPPRNEKVRCARADTCAALLRKTMILIAVVASHAAWDAAHPAAGFPAGRHAVEVGDYERALARCFGIYAEKCRRPPRCSGASPAPVRPPEPAPQPAVRAVPTPWPRPSFHLPPPPPAPAVGAVAITILLIIILSPVGA